MKRTITLAVLVSLALCVPAQEKKNVFAAMYCIDSFTSESLKDAKISVMSSDSVVIAVLRPLEIFKNSDKYRWFGSVPIQRRYIVKAEHNGYDTEYTAIDTFQDDGTGRKIISHEFVMHRSAIMLDEVVVKGTKILMVNRGDTIIYNVSALQLSNGSMLDALIKQLPGVELHNDGRITVNGKYVSELLVNGRDFFKGDPKIALENLPAYYVDKVKVFHKTSKKRQVMYGDSAKVDEHLDSYVMDVQLKRDYAEGWLGNAEAGYGTHERWMARFFAMRYTKHFGLFAFCNLNNLNDNQSADKNGGWAGQTSNEGLVKARTFGINLNGDDKMTGMEFSTSAKLSIADGDYENTTSADNYYSTGNVYQRSRSQQSNRKTNLNWNGSWSYPKKGKFHLSLYPSVSYSQTDNHDLSRSASFSSDPQDGYRGAAIDSLYAPLGSQRLTQLLINQQEMQTTGNSHHLNISASSYNGIKIVGSHSLDFNMSALYNRFRRKDNNLQQLNYSSLYSQNAELLNKYTYQPSMDYEYKVRLDYILIQRVIRGKSILSSVGYQYRQSYSSGERQLYRLDRYNGYDQVGVLPSTTDSLQAVIDMRNSYNTSSLTREHWVEWQLNYGSWLLYIPVSFAADCITDFRNSQQKMLSKHRMSWSPSLFYYLKRELYVTYNLSEQLPSMYYLLNIRDDSDPLNIALGNTDLKNTYNHHLTVTYRKSKNERQQNINLRFDANLTQNAVCIGRNYDLTTGVTTSRPDNINGNWNMKGNFSFGQQVDRQNHLRLTTTTDASFIHNVDYASLQQATSERNTVNNLRLGETLKAEYRLDGWYVAATTHADWNHADSPTESFITVNAWDYNYGLKLTKQIVKDFDLDTEMMMWSRRGYTDPTMNSDELIWNASLNYSFGKKGEWAVKAKGYDILRRRSSVRQSMNAQGRTETWYKTVPSYWMLHLTYQFKKAPNKK